MIQIPTLASCGFDEMVDAAIPDQIQFLQLYVNADRARTIKIIKHAAERGVKALFITVDAPQLGRREKVSAGGSCFSWWLCIGRVTKGREQWDPYAARVEDITLPFHVIQGLSPRCLHSLQPDR